MAVAQSSYGTAIANGYAGQVANGETSNRIVRTIEDAAGIGFGKAAFRGAGDHGITATPTAGTFLGITIAHYAPQVNAASGAMADQYPQYASVPIMTLGSIWAVVGEDVTDGAAVYVTAGGAFVDTVGANIPLPGWVFDMTVANNGLARIVRR